jgi:hypothetical protein
VSAPPRAARPGPLGRCDAPTCRSPESYTHLKSGRHSFEVGAVNAAGVDPRPAVKQFTIWLSSVGRERSEVRSFGG